MLSKASSRILKCFQYCQKNHCVLCVKNLQLDFPYFCKMGQILTFIIIISSLSILNVTMYWIFSLFIINRNNPGLRFLGINLLKDIIWLTGILFFIDKTKVNFLILSLIFLISSFLIYYFVIVRLNKS